MEAKGAFLGISVGSPYYSKQRIRKYLDYAKKRFNVFAFLLGDEIFRYTLAGLRGISIDEATSRARKIGIERESMLKDLIRNEVFPISVIRWNYIQNIPMYSLMIEAIQLAYRNDISFKEMVRTQIFLNLGDRVEETGLSRDPSIDNDISFFFDSYILEEVAGLITISEITPYSVEIYPGRDLLILQHIYEDKYTEITKALPLKRKREFLQLKID